MIHIGIDPGTTTGLAVWDSIRKRFRQIDSLKIHEAMDVVSELSTLNTGNIHIWVEDARQRTWFGSKSDSKLQGAGSIKRDCTIWEDFLKDLNVPFDMVHPQKNSTKVPDGYFKGITGYQDKCSEHGRDAAMLVINR